MATGFSKLEDRLAMLESQPVLSATLNSGCVKETDTEISEETAEDLTTTNMEAFRALNEPTSTAQKVGKELIGTCITPSKIKHVQLILEKENERHLCPLKLLPYFFAKEEQECSAQRSE